MADCCASGSIHQCRTVRRSSSESISLSIRIQAYFEWTNREGVHRIHGFRYSSRTTCARKLPPFYGKFGEIRLMKLGTHWNHVDLFFSRDANQNALYNRIFNNHANLDLNEFGRMQFDLAKELIKAAQPQMVLVANAKAARLFEVKFQLAC